MRRSKITTSVWLRLIILTTLGALLFTGCTNIISANGKKQTNEEAIKVQKSKENSPSKEILNKQGQTIKERYNTPEGFKRVGLEGKSFGAFLREQKLRPYDELHCLDGVYDSILDIAIKPENVHQSSALMLMRAEYLYSQKRYDEINFKFESGFIAQYQKWMQGNTLDKQGDNVQWVQRGQASNKPEDLGNFMDAVFKYSGGLTIEDMLVPVEISEMAIGDTFIRGGGVGQIAMVVDMAVHQETGEKIFILAQTNIATKETCILLNPNNPERNPWYTQDMGEGLQTPEGKFVKSDLKGYR